MSLDLTEAPATKTRKPRAVKTSTPTGVSKDKVTLCLDTDLNFRLTVHAAALKMDRSELVAKLIRDNLRRFVVSDRGERDTTEDRQPMTAA